MANTNNTFEKNAGIALIIFCILLLFAMVLHPAGGNVRHLIKKSAMILITHGVAIASLPVGAVGFWGLTGKIGANRIITLIGFAFILLGLMATLLAAATNGLILPLYLKQYAEANDDVLNGLQPILRYGFTINKAFDYVYTGAFSIAILCWSVEIISTKKMMVWIGWMGVVLALIMLIIFFGNMSAANNLKGLRIFLSGILIWIVMAGMELMKKRGE